MFNLKNTIITCLLVAAVVFADGLMVPTNESYPKDFLKNRLTHVKVKIHGLIAETQVYQEFINEGNTSTDAVYSFPLPENAKATEFIYWYNDTTYKAVLKVKEQATNPGTGEGGIIAEVNDYIGRNGIKILLKDIAPGAIQKVRLHYISMCDFYRGTASYKFPLETKKFITYPLDHLQFSFNVDAHSTIKEYNMSAFHNFKTISRTDSTLQLEMIQPKAYLDQNLTFSYTTDHNKLAVDFFSAANDTSPGHFALLLRPTNEAEPDSILGRRFIYVLSNSNTMFGYQLEESIAAITETLDMLNSDDFFNILVYSYSVSSWNTMPVKATVQNIQSAKNYLAAISQSYNSRLDLAMEAALQQISDDSMSNAVLVFSDGNSPLYPDLIRNQNVYNTGIFPIAVGQNINRSRLELLADLNYGFTTYISADDNIKEKIIRLFNQISQPVLRNVVMEYGRADLTQLIPQNTPTTYAGSYFFTTGRYSNPGISALSIAGTGINKTNFYNFRLDFSGDTLKNKFVEALWAKEMIDNLEYETDVYGESAERKEQLIDLSLKYNIRCRYTAYIADYETIWTTSLEQEKLAQIPRSFLQRNYPNPFNPITTIRLFIDNHAVGKVILLKVYNILGQLVAVIDISHLTSGWHNVLFNGKDLYGNILPSGVYFVQMQVHNTVYSTIRMNLIK